MTLEMLVEMQIKILNGGEIWVYCKTKLLECEDTMDNPPQKKKTGGTYPDRRAAAAGIKPLQPRSGFEFVLRDT